MSSRSHTVSATASGLVFPGVTKDVSSHPRTPTPRGRASVFPAPQRRRRVFDLARVSFFLPPLALASLSLVEKLVHRRYHKVRGVMLVRAHLLVVLPRFEARLTQVVVRALAAVVPGGQDVVPAVVAVERQLDGGAVDVRIRAPHRLLAALPVADAHPLVRRGRLETDAHRAGRVLAPLRGEAFALLERALDDRGGEARHHGAALRATGSVTRRKKKCATKTSATRNGRNNPSRDRRSQVRGNFGGNGQRGTKTSSRFSRQGDRGSSAPPFAAPPQRSAQDVSFRFERLSARATPTAVSRSARVPRPAPRDREPLSRLCFAQGSEVTET